MTNPTLDANYGITELDLGEEVRAAYRYQARFKQTIVLLFYFFSAISITIINSTKTIFIKTAHILKPSANLEKKNRLEVDMKNSKGV